MRDMREVLLDAWYRGAPWLWLLRPIELLFRVVAALRRCLYRHKLLRVYRAPVPLVVVGGITVGGTGKTPVVIALVEDLQRRGIRVGTVSRGYGANALTSPHRLTEQSTAAQCGDELLLIHLRTGCPCVAATDRAKGVQMLLANDPVDIVISDDGLQHYALARELEIAVLDQQRGTGNGFCLPAGPLREPVRRLEKVDYVLHRGGADRASAVNYRADNLVHLKSGRQCSAAPEALGHAIHAVAGIGQPGQFVDELRRLGFEPKAHLFADHHRYIAEDFSSLRDRPIIMTEKDAVKCAELAGDNAWYLKISAQLPETLTNAVARLATPE